MSGQGSLDTSSSGLSRRAEESIKPLCDTREPTVSEAGASSPVAVIKDETGASYSVVLAEPEGAYPDQDDAVDDGDGDDDADLEITFREPGGVAVSKSSGSDFNNKTWRAVGGPVNAVIETEASPAHMKNTRIKMFLLPEQIITKQDGSKLYQCKDCDSVFRERGSLRRHVRSHTGERLFCF